MKTVKIENKRERLLARQQDYEMFHAQEDADWLDEYYEYIRQEKSEAKQEKENRRMTC